MIADGVRVQTIVTSPPYWGLRDYGVPGQLGLERSPLRYLARMRSVFRLAWELLAEDGTLWLNMGDSYHSPRTSGGVGYNSTINGQGTQEAFRDAARARGSRKQVTSLGSMVSGSNRRRSLRGLKPKDLVGMPWLLAFTLRADGWYLRRDIIWHKPNPKPIAGWMNGPGSHSSIDHAREGSGSTKYQGNGVGFGHGFDEKKKPRARQNESFSGSINELVDSRNKRSVWTVPTQPFAGAHFATFPEKLIEPCILAGTRPGEIVFDPFMGAGTVAAVATRLGRHWLGCELNAEYEAMQRPRSAQQGMQL
jgi:DNA modification methylase